MTESVEFATTVTLALGAVGGGVVVVAGAGTVAVVLLTLEGRVSVKRALASVALMSVVWLDTGAAGAGVAGGAVTLADAVVVVVFTTVIFVLMMGKAVVEVTLTVVLAAGTTVLFSATGAAVLFSVVFTTITGSVWLSTGLAGGGVVGGAVTLTVKLEDEEAGGGGAAVELAGEVKLVTPRLLRVSFAAFFLIEVKELLAVLERMGPRVEVMLMVWSPFMPLPYPSMIVGSLKVWLVASALSVSSDSV